jgi:hypothetical protein
MYFDNEIAMDNIVQTIRLEVTDAEIPSFVEHLAQAVEDLQESKQGLGLRRADDFRNLIAALSLP